jgi:hypothetical protein
LCGRQRNLVACDAEIRPPFKLRLSGFGPTPNSSNDNYFCRSGGPGVPAVVVVAGVLPSGRSASLRLVKHGGDEGSENSVHSGLIARSLRLEPREDITVNPQRDRLFRHRIHNHRVRPEIVGQAGQLARGGALDLAIAPAPEPGEVCTAPSGTITGC